MEVWQTCVECVHLKRPGPLSMALLGATVAWSSVGPMELVQGSLPAPISLTFAFSLIPSAHGEALPCEGGLLHTEAGNTFALSTSCIQAKLT